tara:strand:- start:147 stop:476 length:330 start_codon:yes stop_codon:yes gene_type:complete
MDVEFFKIYEKFGLTEEEYNKLRYGFLPQFVLHTDENSSSALYFDGDDGVSLFENPSEVFDDLGFSIKLIDCDYCDMSMTDMLEIAHTLDDEKWREWVNKPVKFKGNRR